MSSAILYNFRNTWRIIPVERRWRNDEALSEGTKTALSKTSLLRKVESFSESVNSSFFISDVRVDILSYLAAPFETNLLFAPFGTFSFAPSFICKGSLSDAINRCPSYFTYLEIFNEGEWSTLDLRRNKS